MATLTVTTNADSGTGSLRQAIADATAIDTITFDASLSGETITLSSPIDITHAVEIVGLVDGGGKPAITLSGNNGSYRILSGNYSKVISNLIFKDAGFRAIYIANGVDGSSFTNCEFNNNSVTNGSGGAVYYYGASGGTDSASFTDCVFKNNSAIKTSSSGNGGAISLNRINATFTRCVFFENTATGQQGGALTLGSTATTTFISCVFENNSVGTTGKENYGGAVLAIGSVSFTNCSFSGNSALWCGGAFGGGPSSNATFSNCSFSENKITEIGIITFSNPSVTTRTQGSAIFTQGVVACNDCTFTDNTSLGYGTVTGTSGSITLTSCTFSGSTASYGSGKDVYAFSWTAATTINLNDGNDLSGGMNFETGQNVVFSGYNGIGTALGSATFSGSGFLALPSSASITLPSTVTRTVYGAGVSNLTANNLTLSWSSTDSTKSVLLEKQNGASWDVVSTSATSPTTVLSEGSYRIWDGATFLTQSVIIPPATLVVTNTNDSGSGSLRAALASARAVDTVTFDDSLNGETITLASGLTLTDAVEIVGLVDANGDPAITISGANTYRILSGDYKITLSNLIFANAGDNAIYNENAAGSSFTNCVFSNNSATDSYAGAVLLMGVNAATDSATFTDCVFSGNESRTSSVNGYGGALSTSNLNVNATDCTFTNNTAQGELGGAIAFFSSVSTLTLDGCTFTGNSIATRTGSTGLKDCGGAIYSAGDLVATDCTFTNNSVSNSYDGDAGGAVYSLSNGTFTNCTFQNCTTTTNNGGGAIYVDYNSSLHLDDCDFRDATSDVALLNSSILSMSAGITTIPALSTVNSTISILSGSALTITNAATLSGSVNGVGRAYLATPPGTDLTGATLTNIVACDYGAGVSAFSIDEDGADWTATNSNISVLLEKKVNNAWQTLAQPTGTSYSTTFVDGDEARIFDGIQFRTASAIVPTTIVVTNTNPTGAGSLAQAVLDARAVDTITFDPSLSGSTITLNAGLGPRNEITIVGLTDDDGNPAIIVDGNDNYAFNSSYPVHVSNVAFDGGWGAFSSNGGFDGSTFENCTFGNMDLNVFELSNSSQTAESVSFTDCVFSNNDAADMLITGNVNATLNGGNVLTEGLDLTNATTTVITNANYNGVGAYSAPSAGTASVAGSGHIALPGAATITIAQTVTRSEFGAGLTGISANELTISWTATDSTKSVLLEAENGSDWDTVDAAATSPATVSAAGTYRVWDGVAFFSTSVEPEPAIAVRPGRRVCQSLQFDYTNEGAETIDAGTAIKIGSAFGVIETAILPGATGTVTTLGTWFIPCLDTTVADFGDVAYWDDENQRVTSNDSGTMRIGLFIKPVSSGETEATVMIFPASAASSGD